MITVGSRPFLPIIDADMSEEIRKGSSQNSLTDQAIAELTTEESNGESKEESNEVVSKGRVAQIAAWQNKVVPKVATI